MSFFETLNVSASGLSAQRLRMDVISQNLANINTTKTEDGGPYKRKAVLFEERKGIMPFSNYLSNSISATNKGNGVRVAKIVEDEALGALVYDPGHPDADEDGYVRMPNVNVVTEMVNMISATRSYEANVQAMQATKGMMSKTLEISR